MWRILLVLNMILSLVFMFVGEIDRATFHLVWCVLCQLGVERQS
ncbi:hypothetical protein [Sphingopyxis bauzanensis]|nr:hypothetical protein [Sphingopyxis bauzanensis]